MIELAIDWPTRQKGKVNTKLSFVLSLRENGTYLLSLSFSSSTPRPTPGREAGGKYSNHEICYGSRGMKHATEVPISRTAKPTQ